MTLHLNPEHLEALRSHAERAYPNECCGLVLGTLTQADRILVDLHPVENAWNEAVAVELKDDSSFKKSRRYWIAPEEMLKVTQAARRRGLDIIGVYHSHPNHPAIPSECDRRLAWPHYSYLIIAVEHNKAKDLRSWRLNDDHEFHAETIILESALTPTPNP